MSLFGSIFGDSKDTDPGRGPAELAEISKGLINEAAPLRQALMSRYTNFVTGGSPTSTVTSSPIMNPGFSSSVEDYYKQNPDKARELYLYGATPAPGMEERFQKNRMDEMINAAPDWLRHNQTIYPSVTQTQTSSSPSSSDITSLPQFASLKDAISRQFNIAKNNVISTTAPGGAMTSALTNLEGTRAATTVSGIAGLADQELSRAFALGTGTTPTALGGLSSAAGALGNIGMAQAAQQSQAMSGLGYGIGSSMGRKGASTGGKSATEGMSA